MYNIQKPRRGLRILVVEAAGAKGLSSLTILAEIATRLQDEEGLDEIPKPNECFDLIVTLLGRLGVSIEKAAEYFKTLGKDVFTDKKAMSKITGSTDYKTTRLKQVLKNIIQEVAGNENEPMMESHPDPRCKTMVFAMSKHNMNAGIPTIFRSYQARTNIMPDCAIWEAICASTAHPGHFKSIEIGQPPADESFVAGAFGCSNPIVHALEEIKRVCPDEHVASIISIGAGHARTIHIPEPNPLQRLLPMDVGIITMNIVTDSERVARDVAVRFQATADVYFRLSVEQGMQDIAMDDWSMLGKVLAHTRAYMRKPEVNTIIDRAVKAISAQQPAIPTAQIDGQIITTSVQKATGIKYCPDPSPVFTGQGEKIDQVERKIINGDKERCVFVLHGLGGSGKTQIALKTIQKTRDIWTDIVYVDATSRDTTITTLEGFAKAKQIGDTYEDTIGWLSTHRERWLMVFDNADDPSLGVNRFFPTGDHGSILITTRIPHLALLAQGSESDCSVSGLDPSEALELLLKTARVTSDSMSIVEHDAAAILLKKIGYLALAIVHAGSYIFCSKCTFRQYLEMFDKHRQATLEKYANLLVKVDDYERSVYTTWYMSYERLSPRAHQMLWLMAYMHHDNIIEDIFRRAAIHAQTYEPLIPASNDETEAQLYVTDYLLPFLDPNDTWDSGAFLAIMTELMSYSLISYDRTNAAYTLHVLVHDWASTVIPHPGALAIKHTEFLLAVSVDYGESTEDYAFKRTLETHVNKVLDRPAQPAANHAAFFAEVYDCAGRWNRSEALQFQVLEVRKRVHGAEHPSTLTTMNNLAVTYKDLGRYEQAEALQVQVLEIRKRVHGAEHPETLTSMNNLALTYKHLGRYEQAEALQVQELEICKRVHGAEHPSTLTSMNNLALTYQDLGRYEQAEALQVQVLEIRKRVHGAEHPSTLTSMNNLALTYRHLGRYEQAEALQVQELEVRKRVHGAEHPSTLTSMNNLALTYRHLGRYEQAEALQVQVLEVHKRVHGAEHPSTLTSMNNLALTYQHLGRYEQAEALQVQELEVRKRVRGAEHPSTLTTMNNLALTYQDLGRYEQAEALQVQELEICKRVHGAEHPETLTSMNNLALTYKHLGRYEQAEALQVQELEVRKRVRGAEHPSTLTTMNNLALTYQDLGRYEQAEALQVQELEICKRVHGAEHPETLTSMNNLALTYKHLGRYEQAEALQVQELEICKRVRGAEHPETLISMENLAITYRDLGRYEQADALELQVLEIPQNPGS